MAGLRPLAAFSDNWVGGDIHGLRGVAEQLYRYVPRLRDVTGRLSVVARDLVSDGPDGWQGAAADAFAASWGRQEKMAAALEDFVTAVADAVDGLAVELSQIENALEDQAYEASKHGVRIGAGGTVTGFGGVRGLEQATAYTRVRDQAMAEAGAAREAAARRLTGLVAAIEDADPHPNPGDAVTMGGLLADLMASPTASRREVNARIKKLTGKNLKFDQEIADAKRAGRSAQEAVGESTKVEEELQKVQEELPGTGKLETELGKLLDTRVNDVQDRLQGKAGEGRHVAGNTPADLRAAADHEPGVLEQVFDAGSKIPVVDIGATALGTAVGTYYDVQEGQPPGVALGDEAASNTAGLAAGNAAAAGVAGSQIGERLGALGGPAGIVAGAAAGYVIGDLTHNALEENWGQDIREHGVVHGTLDGTGHIVDQTADDIRETATGAGHAAEHYWDDLFGG